MPSVRDALASGPVSAALLAGLRAASEGSDAVLAYRGTLSGAGGALSGVRSAAMPPAAAPPPLGIGARRRKSIFSEALDAAALVPRVVAKAPEERAAIEAALARNPLLAGLDGPTRRVLADAMEPVSFAPGARIISQGDERGEFYYVVGAGAADVDVSGVHVLTVRPGGGFGELALLYGAPRAASVTACGCGVGGWAIDRRAFKGALAGEMERRRAAFSALLRGMPLLERLTAEEVAVVADALRRVALPEGAVVIEQGDAEADAFYIVEDGELKATKEGACRGGGGAGGGNGGNERRHPLTRRAPPPLPAGVPGEVCPRLRRGAHFGERALLTREPRAATVTACSPSSVLVMEVAAFRRLLGPFKDRLDRAHEGHAEFERRSRDAEFERRSREGGSGGGGGAAALPDSPTPYDRSPRSDAEGGGGNSGVATSAG